jgi:hypothetical protein
MPIDPATFLKDLKTVNSQLNTTKALMTTLQNGFEPPPDPDKPGLLAQLALIDQSLAAIQAISTNLENLINGM